MDAVNDPRVREIVVMKSAQVGWTETLGNVVGYFVHQDPTSMLLIQPTVEFAKDWSKTRLQPMLRDTPELRALVAEARSRDSGNTIADKSFPGGFIKIVGANAPQGLAGRTVRIVLCDEVDRYPASAGVEGDPVSLARKRAATFWNSKVLLGSTPTVQGASRIEAAFEGSDRRYYLVPCPHCGTEQRLRWEQVRWPANEPRRACYVCAECGVELTDADKSRMLQRGRWQATADSDGVAGFHISELYSPWVKFGQMAAAFVEAKRSPQTLQTWVNTSLGETWVERGDAPSWEAVGALRQDYESGEVPDGALALVAGVDVQNNRLVYVVRAFGRALSSWLIEHGELYGETDRPDVWQRLADLLDTRFGDDRPIRMMAIDSGFRAEMVYEFVRRHPAARAVKGRDGQSAPVRAATIDVTTRGRTVRRGLQLWHVDSSYFKSWVHGRLEWAVDQPGAWLLPRDASDDYCRQIVAESRIALPSGRVVWKRHDRENHYLDAEAYAAACAHMLQIHRVKAEEPVERAPQAAPAVTPAAAIHSRRARRPIVGRTW